MHKIEYLKGIDGFFAISEYSAKETAKLLNAPFKSIINISTACDDVFKVVEMATLKQEDLIKYGISKKFVLYTGGCDRRKNLTRLIQAYAQLPKNMRSNYQLVFAGKMPNEEIIKFRKIAHQEGLSQTDFLMIGYVSEEKLVVLYNKCELFIFPSVCEGFGLPVLEAINCGVPVIASNTSSIPEVVGCDEALFNPLDAKDIAEKISRVLNNTEYRKKIVAQEQQHKPKFSWDISSQRAIEYLEKQYVKNVNSDHKRYATTDGILTKLACSKEIDLLSEKELKGYSSILALNIPQRRRRHIYVDISELVTKDAKTGVQRVVRSILKEFLSLNIPGFMVMPVYASIGTVGYLHARQYMKSLGFNEDNESDDYPIEFQNSDIFLGLDLQHQVVHSQQDYLHFMQRHGVRVLFVLYDLLPVLFKDCFECAMFDCHARWLKEITSFDGVVSISHAVSSELDLWMQDNVPDNIQYCKNKWFHLGADIDNSVPSMGMPADAATILKMLALRPSFLMVGTIEPRKRQDLALEAFEKLWSSGLDVNLVIVGKKGWKTETLCKKLMNHPEVGKHLFWLNGISDEYLEKVYTASTCLIAASEGEGFGLPLIEAAQKNLPIIARDIPVFREVAGEYAYYFSGKTGDELAEAVKDWLALYQAGKHPKSDDMPWLTWKESAQQLLKAIGIEEIQ